ncbi:hypothetical protein [Methanoregula formicica]|uniref:Uncharacterized protein n=1 Tax=Methanoregula formicica (strain DSM 22288 / NBRC 105244 / SMSP) TaxID=593750 RepID=L0HE36_METFS|nr:hypothetical protein [Methanoregula formicica]AGB01583.1 hypothetical protein Metfor_0513 [Methanoregula formicica SMSP]
MPGQQHVIGRGCKTWRRTLRPVIAIIFLSLLFLPVTAADDGSSSDTVAIRQAHLAWTALDKEYDFSTAVMYCNTLYGSDTTEMSRLLAEFRKQETRIKDTATSTEVDALIEDMRNTTGRFREETFSVMTKGQGKWDVLESQILDAKNNNPYLLQKKDQYWTTRTKAQLAAFDTWVREGQERLDILKAQGYDTTTTQRSLDVFASKKPTVSAAFAAKSETSIRSANQLIQPLSQDFIQELAEVQEQVPDTIRFQFLIDQAYRATALCDKANAELLPILLDIDNTVALVKKTKSDLTNAQRMLNTGSLENTKTPLRLVQKDLSDLAQVYRDIASTMDLGTELNSELNTIALRLDNTADQMRDAL